MKGMVRKNQIIGKKIVGFEPGSFKDGMGGTAHDPLILLEDGRSLYFVTEETETGEYGVFIGIRSESRTESLCEYRSEAQTPAQKLSGLPNCEGAVDYIIPDYFVIVPNGRKDKHLHLCHSHAKWYASWHPLEAKNLRKEEADGNC